MLWSRRRRRVCSALLCGTVLLATLYLLLSAVPTLPQLAQTHTCPACFGTGLCQDVLSGAVSLTDHSSVSNLVNALSTKNVFFGTYKGQCVVIKKLAHSSEIRELDRKLCSASDRGHNCHVNEAFDSLKDVYHQIVNYVSQSPGDGILNSFHLCPSADKLDLLFTNVVRNNKNVSPHYALAHIWMLIHLNAEPLVLQILTPEEGWPVPKYYGACGRLVVEEYVGDTLQKYLKAPWPTRAHLAHQLLTAALHFTDRHPTFRFYLTDISLDNVAVDANNQIRFIDLENIIVLDKYPQYRVRPISWSDSHVSEKYECENCFAFSSNDICNHHISDHNFFAVCQELLMGHSPGSGLLSKIPPAALQRQPSLTSWLQQCVHSAGAGTEGRRSAALQLAAALGAEASSFAP